MKLWLMTATCTALLACTNSNEAGDAGRESSPASDAGAEGSHGDGGRSDGSGDDGSVRDGGGASGHDGNSDAGGSGGDGAGGNSGSSHDAALGDAGDENDSGGSAGVSGGVGSCTGTNVCTTDYPCETLAPSYTCRGQFLDWPPGSPGPFTVHGDGTVTDTRSGLLWQQGVAANLQTWKNAKAYCATLTLAGTGWRLPTEAELESIVDDSRFDPALDPTAFPNPPDIAFWSASPVASAPSVAAWHVHFRTGFSGSDLNANTYAVRCVR